MKICEVCKNEFKVIWKKNPNRFCSDKCRSDGSIGKYVSDDTKDKISEAQSIRFSKMFTLKDRYSLLVKNRTTDKCILWKHAKHSFGYGTIKIEGKQTMAYKYFYEQEKGVVPDGLFLDHLCRVPACINPDHLEPVTHAENMRRGMNAKLTHERVAEIRSKADVSHEELSKEYGIDKSQISRILNYKAWSNIVGAKYIKI